MDPPESDTLVEAVMEVLRAHFDLPRGTVIVSGCIVPGLEGILRPDFDVQALDVRYLVQVKQRLTAQDIAMVLLAREALGRAGGTEAVRVEPVIICKAMSPRLQTLAASVDVHVFQLDWKVPLPGSGKGGSVFKARKVTSYKSWRVVSTLLRSGPTSIKALAREAGSSYGWAHATVAKLMDMGVASRTAEGVTVVDVSKLLNGAAWERPLGELRRRTVRVGGEDAMTATRTVQSALEGWGVEHAFTAWTAGAIYTGYIKRSDSVHLYLPRGNWDFMRELEVRKGSIDLVAYMPDRDVFSRTERIQGLDLVEPAQALLDLAGLGHAAHDLAVEMVRHLAEHRR